MTIDPMALEKVIRKGNVMRPVADGMLSEIGCKMTIHPDRNLKKYTENLAGYLKRNYPKNCTPELLAKASEKTITIA